MTDNVDIAPRQGDTERQSADYMRIEWRENVEHAGFADGTFIEWRNRAGQRCLEGWCKLVGWIGEAIPALRFFASLTAPISIAAATDSEYERPFLS